jgi:hypothetical protein
MTSNMITRIERSIARTRVLETEAARQRAIRRQFDEWELNLMDLSVRAQLAEELRSEMARQKAEEAKFQKALEDGRKAIAKADKEIAARRQARNEMIARKFLMIAVLGAPVFLALVRLIAFFN